MAHPRSPNLGPVYFTLDDDIPPGAVRTCGDPVRAHVHLHPPAGETLSISNLRVNFKCKARTLISTGSGNNRRLHKSKVYLFFFSTQILGNNTISINSPQSWPVAFEFPWEVLPSPTQMPFRPNPMFANQAGHRLPPTWWRECRGHVQSVTYYLEAVMTRRGRMMDHTDKKMLPMSFSPPLDHPDPPPNVRSGLRQSIVRSSQLLDPDKRDEHYGFRERTKHLFSNETDPVAMFSVSASAPSVVCAGDKLPVTLHVNYDESRSTAPKPPELLLKSIHVRLTDLAQYRVSYQTVFMDSDLQRDSEAKLNILQRTLHPNQPVYDGMLLNDIVQLALTPNLGCTFVTFTINRGYMLKISAIFECAGKDFDVVLARHPLIVHPNRALFRPLPGTPGAVQSPPLPEQSLPPPDQQADMLATTEVPPPYIASPSDTKPPPPAYDTADEKK